MNELSRRLVTTLAATEALASQAQPHDLSNGETLFHQGDAGGQIYLIEQGYLMLSYVDNAGRAYIANILNCGEIIGIGSAPADAMQHTATAKINARINAYPAQAFMQCISENPELQQTILLMQSQRERLLHRRLQAVLNLDVKQRIVIALNDLTSHYGQPCEHGHRVDIPLTQEELAQLIGASRPVVSTRLNELRRDGLLSYEHGFICINEVDNLHKMAKSESD